MSDEKPTLTADMPIRPSGTFELELWRGRKLVHVRSMPREVFNHATERQCQQNHSGQTLERLRERQGLSARECLAILSVVPFAAFEGVSEETAFRALYAWSCAYRAGGLYAKSQPPT